MLFVILIAKDNFDATVVANFFSIQLKLLLLWTLSTHPNSTIKMHKSWDHLTWIIAIIGTSSCYVTYQNHYYHHENYSNLSFITVYFMILNLIQCGYFLYLLVLIFTFYIICCGLGNNCKPSPTYFPESSHITSENEPIKVDFLLKSNWNNIGMSILPGRQQAKNNRNLEMDIKRIIFDLNIHYIATLLPFYQLNKCNCSDIFNVANKLYNSTESKVLHYPIHDFVVPDDINDFDNNCIDLLLTQKKKLDENKQNMLIHCYGGQGRTGIVIACMMMKADNFTLNECIKAMRAVRGNRMLTNPLQQRFCNFYYHYFVLNNRKDK